MITAVIVTYNSSEDIAQCLEALKGLDVIVVDNASSDDTLKIVSRYDVRLIRNKRNLGYGAGANAGIAAAQTEYVLLLNPDVVISAKEAAKMAAFMREKGCDVQGPRLLDSSGKLLYSCRRFPTLRAMVGRRLGFFKDEVRRHLMKDFSHKKALKVDWVSGGCMMLKRGMLFDERFFLYLEDVDLCHGKEVWYNPSAVAVHKVQRGSVRSFRMFWYHLVSAVKYFWKWGMRV